MKRPHFQDPKRVEKVLADLGFHRVKSRSSHRQWKAHGRSLRITVPSHRELSLGVGISIARSLESAGILSLGDYEYRLRCA